VWFSNLVTQVVVGYARGRLNLLPAFCERGSLSVWLQVLSPFGNRRWLDGHMFVYEEITAFAVVSDLISGLEIRTAD